MTSFFYLLRKYDIATPSFYNTAVVINFQSFVDFLQRQICGKDVKDQISINFLFSPFFFCFFSQISTSNSVHLPIVFHAICLLVNQKKRIH
jgi:hypothetical protein